MMNLSSFIWVKALFGLFWVALKRKEKIPNFSGKSGNLGTKALCLNLGPKQLNTNKLINLEKAIGYSNSFKLSVFSKHSCCRIKAINSWRFVVSWPDTIQQ